GAEGVELEALTVGEVTAFLVAQSRRLAPKTTQRLAIALRSLLRFWHVGGLIAGPLAQSVPKVANRRTGLPHALDSQSRSRPCCRAVSETAAPGSGTWPS
ncbi:MAG: hypothetical protein ACRDKX_09610, partial [Solirubrobacterales bacterium]